ncbi:MAG: hypothetical protein P4K94_02905 [Terracidiphilus sp.]|nr:hypothetical protein [Terracidiphilus sp.]
MAAFDNPSACSFAGILAFFIGFLAAGLHLEFIVVQAAGHCTYRTIAVKLPASSTPGMVGMGAFAVRARAGG